MTQEFQESREQVNQSPTAPGEVTQLLAAVRQGDGSAMDRLMTVVYDELRAVARRQLRRWRPGQTLDTIALVHEAYLRLVDHARASWQDRTHFLSVAGIAMRQILVDAARRRTAKKREGLRISFDELRPGQGGPDASVQAVEILALDEALTSLAARNERLSRLVELRFFAGLTEEETAQTLGTSERTVRRDWLKARAFLFHTLRDRAEG